MPRDSAKPSKRDWPEQVSRSTSRIQPSPSSSALRAIEQGQPWKDVRLMTSTLAGSPHETPLVDRVGSCYRPGPSDHATHWEARVPTSSERSTVTVERDGHVLLIGLNRPDK